jgi:hypothetical protein
MLVEPGFGALPGARIDAALNGFDRHGQLQPLLRTRNPGLLAPTRSHRSADNRRLRS